MEEKRWGRFLYLPIIWFVVLTVYTFIRLFYDRNLLEAAPAYISFWKLALVTLLLIGFTACRGQRKTVGIAAVSLFCILLLEILYSTGLCMYVSYREGGTVSFEYALLVLSRIVYAHGIAGSVGLIFGCLCGAFLKSRIAYVFVALVAVCGSNYMDSYRYDFENGNPYNPYSLKDIFRLKDGSDSPVADLAEHLLGPVEEDYTAAVPNICIDRQEIELWLNRSHLFEARVEMTFVPESSGEQIFRLNSIMTVESVADGAGNLLAWKQKGHYICVKNTEGLDRIAVHYYCDDKEFLAIRGAYVSLPAYVMFCPSGVEEECEYSAVVHAKDKVCSNLPKVGENEFAGRAASFSVLGGKMIAETEFHGIRIIYPSIADGIGEIQTKYQYWMVLGAEQHMEGKDFFVDTRIGEGYLNYYHYEELAGEDYVFWWR